MSAEGISASAGVPPDALATNERVHQLQTLIDQVCQTGAAGLAGNPAQTNTTDFASVLQAATTGTSSGAQSQGTTQAEGASSAYDPLIEQAAARYGLDPAILHGLIQQESDFNPSAQSSAGAAGLTQLMPGTASSLGVANPLDPTESIEGGARYLSQLMSQFGGNTTDALAAYNAGPGAVSQYGGVPPYPETQSYVTKVLGYAESYRQAHGGSGGAGSLQYTAGAPPGVPPGGLAYDASALATYPARTATAEGQLRVTPPSSTQPISGRSGVGESAPALATSSAATITSLTGSTGKGTSDALTTDAQRPIAIPLNGTATTAAQTRPTQGPARMDIGLTRTAAASTTGASQPQARLPQDALGVSTLPVAAGMHTADSRGIPARGARTAIAGQPLIATTGTLEGEEAASTQAAIEPSFSTQPAGAEAGTSLPTGVPMQDMIDSIRATVEIAARQGVARARIELQPQELGHINIRLSQTGDGLRVRVSAETPAGAGALAQGRVELRQSLSSLGISLLTLDIGSSGGSQAREHGERSTGSPAGSSASEAITATANEALGEPESASPPPGPALGEIVDVLA